MKLNNILSLNIFPPFYYYHLKHTTQSKVVKKKARQAMFKSLFVVPSFIFV